MPEISIRADEFYSLCPDKRSRSGLCVVKYCRTATRKGRCMCWKHTIRLWRVRNPMRAAFSTLRDHAKQRRREFGLTFDDFKELAIATGYVEGRGHSPSSLAIDRIDFRRGYVIGNIRVTTVAVNAIKGNHEKKVIISKGTIPWTQIDIDEFIRREQEREAKYDPRRRFDTHETLPVGIVEAAEDLLESLPAWLTREPRTAHDCDCPF